MSDPARWTCPEDYIKFRPRAQHHRLLPARKMDSLDKDDTMAAALYFLEWLIKAVVSFLKEVRMPVSPATQALIDQAEADIPLTQALMATVTGDTTAVSGAQATLTADQASLQTAQAKQLTDALAALNALAADLSVPPGTVIGSPPAAPAAASADKTTKAKASISRALLSHPRVAMAHALSIPWGQIIAVLLQGGLPALEALIQSILAGLGSGTGTTGS